MDRKPFQPIGERARWKIVYEVLAAHDVGEVATYKQMADALKLSDTANRHAIQSAVRRAAIELEQVDNRAIEAEPNVGYRIVTPPEHLRLARQHQKVSRRALQRGHSKVVHVDLSDVAPEIRHSFEIVARAFSMQMDFNRRIDVRQARLEQAIDNMATQQTRTAEELAELKDRLARLESTEHVPWRSHTEAQTKT